MMSPRTPSKLTIGVLFISDVQLLDMSGIDLFSMASKFYLTACELPAPLIARGFDEVVFHYIAEGITTPSPSEKPVPMSKPITYTKASTPTILLTAGIQLNLTHDIAQPDVAAGKLDILFIPGPDPATVASQAMIDYMRSHMDSNKTDVLSICTSIFPLGRAGLLDGKTVTGPRPFVGMKLRKMFPNANWTDDRRWVKDEKSRFWSSGGITNGLDLTIGYMRSKYSSELVDLICELADVGDRSVEYERGKAGMGLSMVWIVVRSVWNGIWGSGSVKRE